MIHLTTSIINFYKGKSHKAVRKDKVYKLGIQFIFSKRKVLIHTCWDSKENERYVIYIFFFFFGLILLKPSGAL